MAMEAVPGAAERRSFYDAELLIARAEMAAERLSMYQDEWVRFKYVWETRKREEADLLRRRRKPEEAERRWKRRQAEEAKWVDNKSLYICTCEYHGNGRGRYRVQVIKLSDLLSCEGKPITVYSSISNTKSESTLLREVGFIDGPDVPLHMRFSVLGSKIVLAGGQHMGLLSGGRYRPTPTYVLETDPKVEPQPKFRNASLPAPALPYFNWIESKIRSEAKRYHINEYRLRKQGKMYSWMESKLRSSQGTNLKLNMDEEVDPLKVLERILLQYDGEKEEGSKSKLNEDKVDVLKNVMNQLFEEGVLEEETQESYLNLESRSNKDGEGGALDLKLLRPDEIHQEPDFIKFSGSFTEVDTSYGLPEENCAEEWDDPSPVICADDRKRQNKVTREATEVDTSYSLPEGNCAEGWDDPSPAICADDQKHQNKVTREVTEVDTSYGLSAENCAEGWDDAWPARWGDPWPARQNKVTREGEIRPNCNVCKSDWEDKKLTYSKLDLKGKIPKLESNLIPELKTDQGQDLWLQGIDDKLYALFELHCSHVAFQVFDPKGMSVWTPLPPPPIDVHQTYLHECSIAVMGTKIMFRPPNLYNRPTNALCFDVAHPRRPWWRLKPFKFREDASFFPYNKVIVLDLEDDCEKLIFYCSGNQTIVVYHMMLSDDGEPDFVELVAEIHLPKIDLGPFHEFRVCSYTSAHLGGRKVCFWFMDIKDVLVFTFEFSYSKSSGGSHPPPVHGTDQVLNCTVFSGSFSVKTLGYRVFDFNSTEECNISLSGSFVL